MHRKIDQTLVETVRERIGEILPEVREFRHRVHAEPEIGLETVRTARKVREALGKTSAGVWEPLIGNDVIAELKGGKLTICIRADMDAVPALEANELTYKSAINGSMHACGHDGHTAMLIGAALVLDSLRDQLQVSVRFIFQPGEEVICAGKTLVERGACDGCEAAYAIHGWPGLPQGCISAKEGAQFAAGSFFKIGITGKGCHGALPERGKNPIPVGARVVEELRRIHDRVKEADGSVVSVCSFQAGDSANVIPDRATLLGTTRFFSNNGGDRLEAEIREMVQSIAGEAQVDVDFANDRSYELPTINSAGGYELVKSLAEGYGQWREAEQPEMGMEDFAFYLKGREGAMFLLGLGEDTPALHSPTFDFNDDALEAGILMHCLIALSY